MATKTTDTLCENWGGQGGQGGRGDCFAAACVVVGQRLRRPACDLRRLLARHPLSIGLRSHAELAKASLEHGGIGMRLREHLRQREAVGALTRCDYADGDLCLLAAEMIGFKGADEVIYVAERHGLSAYRGRMPSVWWKFADRKPDERDLITYEVAGADDDGFEDEAAEAADAVEQV